MKSIATAAAASNVPFTAVPQAGPAAREARPPGPFARALDSIGACARCCFAPLRNAGQGHGDRAASGLRDALTSARNPDDQREMQSLRSDHPDVPILYEAMVENDVRTVLEQGAILLEAHLDPAILADQLAAKVDHTPGLYFALQSGRPEAIRAFGAVLRLSELPPEQIAHLLKARRNDGVPGLHIALQEGHPEAIEAFGRVLARCDLDKAQNTRLLSALSPDDAAAPGLYMALQKGYGDAVRAFGKVLLQVDLSARQRAHLLSATRLDGTPGLFIAMQEGRDDAVRAFGQIAIDSGLDPDALADVLAARDRNGNPALAAAMRAGDAKVIRAYGDILEMAAPALTRGQLIAMLRVDLQLASTLEASRAYLEVFARLLPSRVPDRRASV